MPANSAYDSAAAALARPAIRKEMSTAGPTGGGSGPPLATSPASVKMPMPMIPPTPIAVNCHRPRLLDRWLSPLSSTISVIGLRRRMDWEPLQMDMPDSDVRACICRRNPAQGRLRRADALYVFEYGPRTA